MYVVYVLADVVNVYLAIQRNRIQAAQQNHVERERTIVLKRTSECWIWGHKKAMFISYSELYAHNTNASSQPHPYVLVRVCVTSIHKQHDDAIVVL